MNLFAIANALLVGDFSEERVPASSTLVFEIDADNQVSAWFNDEQFELAGCGSTACSVEDYTFALDSLVTITDVEKAC